MRLTKATPKGTLEDEMNKFPEQLGSAVPLAMMLEKQYRGELAEWQKIADRSASMLADLPKKPAPPVPQEHGATISFRDLPVDTVEAERYFQQALIQKVMPKLPLFEDGQHTSALASHPMVSMTAKERAEAYRERARAAISPAFTLSGKAQGMARPPRCEKPSGPKPIYVQRVNSESQAAS